MKVIKFTAGRENARNMDNEKERVNRIRALVLRPAPKDAAYPERAARNRVKTVVDVRFWTGRSANASTVYCSVWVHHKDGSYSSGRGSAGGYGYHKESAALGDALRSAGFEMDEHFGGCGDSAMDAAVLATARKAGFRAPAIL